MLLQLLISEMFMSGSDLPGVHVTQERVTDFCDGIFGVNRAANKRAWEDAAAVVVATVALSSAAKRRKASKAKKGRK